MCGDTRCTVCSPGDEKCIYPTCPNFEGILELPRASSGINRLTGQRRRSHGLWTVLFGPFHRPSLPAGSPFWGGQGMSWWPPHLAGPRPMAAPSLHHGCETSNLLGIACSLSQGGLGKAFPTFVTPISWVGSDRVTLAGSPILRLSPPEIWRWTSGFKFSAACSGPFKPFPPPFEPHIPQNVSRG